MVACFIAVLQLNFPYLTKKPHKNQSHFNAQSIWVVLWEHVLIQG